MSLASVLIKICHIVFKEFQVCNKVSITKTTKPFTMLKYLPNTIYHNLISSSLKTTLKGQKLSVSKYFFWPKYLVN